MNIPALDLVAVGPLASNPLLESIGKALTTGPGLTETMVFLCGLAAFLLLILLSARFFGREPSDDIQPRIDYLTLAVDVLGLSESDRRDLERIARNAHLAQPAAMLLSPANLARAAAPTFEAEGDEELRQRIEHLCVRLFDAPLPDQAQLPGRY